MMMHQLNIISKLKVTWNLLFLYFMIRVCFLLLYYLVLLTFFSQKRSRHKDYTNKKRQRFQTGRMTLVHNFVERLRSSLGMKCWDYFVIWRLSEDQRSLELMSCCCAGIENMHNFEEHFSVSSAIPCRDVSFQHQRTKYCDLLAELPSSIPLDSVSGMRADTLMSNEARWLNLSPNLDSAISEESIGTRVLIPVPIGLFELFVAKQVPEDQQIVEFVTAQFNISLEQQAMMIHSDTLHSGFSVNVNGFLEAPPKHTASDESDAKDSWVRFNSPVDPTSGRQNQDLPRDVSVDRIHLSHSPMNFSQHFSTCSSDNNAGSKNDLMFYEAAATHDLNPFTPSMENGIHEHMDSQPGTMIMQMMEPLSNKEDQVNENDSSKQENPRSNSASESDPNDEEDDTKYRRRTGKGPHCKNLMAERKRRKKLNDRLYSLRALVPKISKLDRASILGDAIEYVKELQKQVEDLQNELEENSDDEVPRNSAKSNNHNIPQPKMFQKKGMMIHRTKSELENISNGYHKGASGSNGGIDLSNKNQERESADEKVQQMEPQVEVTQLDGKEFFVKVFCEHNPGGFVRSMEALYSLGLEVINANATRHTCLVSYIFKVERKDSEILQADDVRESLLELTKNPSRRWCDMSKALSENGDRVDLHQGHHRHHHHHHLQLHSQQMMNTHHLHHPHN